MQTIEHILVAAGDLAWGPWLVVLLVGGGLFFAVYSRFAVYGLLGQAWRLLQGKGLDKDGDGDWTHAQALASALSGTVGMGNITGVALAIGIGGPGAVFWMWVSAFLGMSTKFFTCTLAVMFRGRDSLGRVQGGPMYVIETAMPRQWRFLATFFATAGMLGCMPMLQANQLVQIIREQVLVREGWLLADEPHLGVDALMAGAIVLLVGTVLFGGVRRLGQVTIRLVPLMAALYVGCALWILLANAEQVPHYLQLIVTDAFTAKAGMGGAVGSLILLGIRRGTFSNEAGLGTEALAHGAAKTSEPVTEGIVAMVGPLVDTLIICTATALIILVTDAWQLQGLDGVSLTAAAFESGIPSFGRPLMVICVFFFSVSTLLTYAYYGTKCFAYIFGAEREHWYRIAYLAVVFGTALVSVRAAVGLSDAAFAMMAIPTMISTLYLAPRVLEALRSYRQRLGV
jgi:AGCS family alanine or glycine:cation symporter